MSAVNGGTLAGRRIVITRAPEQSEELISRLTKEGAEVILLPTVRFLEAPETSELDRAIREFEQFDWLIFTSANAVRFLFERCRLLGRQPSVPGPRYAVAGQATRAALQEEGIPGAFMPRQSSAAGLAAEVAAEVAAEMAGELAGKQVLLPRSDRAGGELPAALRAAGARVTAVVAYCTAAPESLDAGALGLLRRGEADALAFFSPSALHHLARDLGSEAMRALEGRVALAAIGPTTAAAIRDAGLRVAVEAPKATADSLVAELERYFAEQSAGKARSG